ncbi:MAG: hypothetical protein WA364_29725, partial [Candidatus Nitrosopolaris sp.]
MENPTNYTAVEMSAPFLSKYSATSTTLLPPDVMTYGALLSPGTGKTVWYYITVTDSKGNKKATDSPSPIFIPSLTRRVAPLPVKLGTHITNVDINNRTADISWSFEDHNSYNPLNPFDLAAGPDLHIYID